MRVESYNTKHKQKAWSFTACWEYSMAQSLNLGAFPASIQPKVKAMIPSKCDSLAASVASFHQKEKEEKNKNKNRMRIKRCIEGHQPLPRRREILIKFLVQSRSNAEWPAG
jgi:hypothetical protein